MRAAAQSRAIELSDLLPRSPFRRSGAVLLITAFSGPVWNVVLLDLPTVSLTVGRGLIVLALMLLALDARRTPSPLPRIAPAVGLLLAALGLLWAWTVVSTVSWGCDCSGDVAGFSELIAVVALVALLATYEPRLCLALLLAVIGGAVLAAVLTLAGVGGLSPGAQNPSPAIDRLSGPYGNPNFLAFAVACSVPAAIAVWRLVPAAVRFVFGTSLALVATVLVLTFSRGGLLAVAAGAALVLVLGQPRGSGARRRTVAGIAVAGAVMALAYPSFADLRRDANTRTVETAPAPDRSGWDARTQGLIPGRPTEMRNRGPRVLEVSSEGPGRGVSHPLPPVPLGGAQELHFDARAVAGAGPLRFGLEDNLLGNGPVQRTAAIDGRWQTLRVRWKPTAESPSPRLYVWAPEAGAGFQIRDIVTVYTSSGGGVTSTPIATALQGAVDVSPEEARAAQEKRDVDSRLFGAELALDAFASQPVRGIGWGDFPRYATAHAERDEFRGLPTHNEYLRFLAELGIIGAALLALVGIAVARAFWRRPLDVLGVALLGMLVTGAVGLAFVNGLAVVAIASPLGFAAALACARAGPGEFAPASGRARWRPLTRAWPALRMPAGWGRPAWSAIRAAASRPPRPVRALRLLARVRAAAPLPVALCGGQVRALQRVRDVAPQPARFGGAALLRGIARGIGRVQTIAPAIAPHGELSALRATDPARRERHEARASLARRVRALNVGSPGRWAAGIGAVALSVRAPLMLERHEIVPGGDSGQYVALAQTFFDQGRASAVRPPGYPLFLALADALPGRMEDAGVVLQLLIGSGLCAAVVFVAWPLFGRLAAVVTGLLLALTAPFLSVEVQLLADALFGVLVTIVAGLIAAAALDDRRRRRWLLATGLAIACAAYVKPIGLVLVLAPVLALALATRSGRATLAGSAAVLLVVALLTVPWMLRNEARYGSFTMSAQTGATLFNRVFEGDGLRIPTDTATGRLAAEVQREHPERRLSSGVTAELLRRGDSRAEAQRKMRAVAIEAVRGSPARYVEGTLAASHRVFADVASGDGENTISTVVTKGAPAPTVTRIGLAAGALLRVAWLAVAFFGFAAALWFLSRNRATRIATAAAIGVWASVAVATAALHGGALRYSASLAPLTFLLAAAGLVVAVKVALAVIETRPRMTPAAFADLVRDAATPSETHDAQVGSTVQ